jgi:hypothetical protein
VFAAVAQRRQRQARSRCDAGSDASTEGLIAIVVHQHGVSNVPARAGAHSFGPPQSGHFNAAMGNMTRWSGRESGLA